MGTWGYEIFEDDTTLDVRGVFEDALAEGVSVVEATHRVIEKMASAVVDYDHGSLVWLALAALQLEQGELQPWVKAPAMWVIDVGIGLEGWQDSGPDEFAKRKAALAAFRAQLEADG